MNQFDTLLDEMAAVARADGRIEADGEFRPSQKSLLTLLKRIVTATVQLAGETKALRAEVAALKAAGTPAPMRKALRLPSGRHQIDGDLFLAKAMTAQAAGRLTGAQVAVAEAHINNGKAPPAEIIEAVLG